MGDRTPTLTLDGEGQALLKRHADWWQGKGLLYTISQSQPLGPLWLPLADGTDAAQDLDLTPDMLDVERLVGPAHEPGPLEVSGDQFQVTAAYGRVPWVEAILGTPIRATIQGGSMRTLSFVDDWAEWERGAAQREDLEGNAWFSLLKRLARLLVERSGGRYAAVQTLMRGPSDLAEAVLGPNLMCFSMYDHPQELRQFLEEVTEVFIEVLRAQLDLIPPVAGGYVNPFGIWTPGTVVRTQCDATAFLSAAQYAEWFLPYDVRICQAVDYSIIHLHSCSLHTVDVLLEVERPHAIQVTIESEPSGPPLEELVPIFRKVLGVKPLIVHGPLSETKARYLLDELPTDGLNLVVRQTAW